MLSHKEFKLNNALVKFEDSILSANTGKIERKWKWIGTGFQTISFIDVSSEKEWISINQDTLGADWSFVKSKIKNKNGLGELIECTISEDSDENFTSPHIRAECIINYPKLNIILKFIIWVYPNSSGIRTQFLLKRTGKIKRSCLLKNNFVDRYFLDSHNLNKSKISAIGYFADTQHRNTPETEIIKEITISSRNTKIDWANVLVITPKDKKDGLIIVKESHKTVNIPQGGIDTGSFLINPESISVTGWGIYKQDIDLDKFIPSWATWTILSPKNESYVQTLKVFDRIRYPIDTSRDMYIMSNTWGSAVDKQGMQNAAAEENVLKEIESAEDLGIDVQQIDDGWQGNDYTLWKPTPQHGRYPNGWIKVKKYAKEKGITLGLWAAVRIPKEDLLRNYDEGGFKYYKLDFANLKSAKHREELMDKARSLIIHSNHTARVNWDVTEIRPRVGYFYGREYGNIYLENRKAEYPKHALYIPYLVLRDTWQVSKYLNLNKFQITVQNIAMVNKEGSDAYLHTQSYCAAITLMGSPIFFQETQYLDEKQRNQIRPLLSTYKSVRKEMFQGYVYPIGEKPNNASWTGFQNHNHLNNTGFLLIFREINNTQTSATIKLKFIHSNTTPLQNLLSNESAKTDTAVIKDGELTCKINEPGDFLFLRY